MSDLDIRIAKLRRAIQQSKNESAQSDIAKAHAEAAQRELAEQIHKKWQDDASTVLAIVKTLNEQLKPDGIAMRATDLGATIELDGTGPASAARLTITLRDGGEVRVELSKQRLVKDFMVLEADRSTYENVLFHLAERLAGVAV